MSNRKKESLKIRDINPFGVRLSENLKGKIEREAQISRRSINAEIVRRLEKSFDPTDNRNGETGVREERAHYADQLSDLDRAMLAVFRSLTPEKQLALLSLFK